MSRTTILAVSTICGVLGLVGIGFATESLSTPIRYEVPSENAGWLVVDWGDATCKPLARDGLYLVVSIPAEGRACTSTPRPSGWSLMRFEAVAGKNRNDLASSGNDQDKRIWGLATRKLSNSDGHVREVLFVGRKDQLTKEAWEAQRHALESPPQLR